jgi:opacity protein-like surface antigen
MTRAIGMAVALLVAATAAPAADDRREAGEYLVAVTPLVGYRMGGSIDDEETSAEATLDDASAFGLAINVPFEGVGDDSYTEWELYVSRQEPGLDRAPENVDPELELEITHILLGGTYVGGGERVRPFLAAGIGAAHLSPDGPGYESDTVFAFGIGVGAQALPASRVGLRFEARLLGSVLDSESALFCASGPAGSACAFRASGDVLWQWDVTAGVTFRF